MDFEMLTRDIIEASRIVLSDILSRYKDEEFYAFVLYTDNDCYTVASMANTIQNHDRLISSEGITDAKNIAGYKWSVDEWVLIGWDDGEFKEICEKLSNASQAACRKNLFLKFKEQVHTCMINVLLELKETGFFNQICNEFVIYISSSENDEAEEMENRSAKILNTPEIYEKFLNRYNV